MSKSRKVRKPQPAVPSSRQLSQTFQVRRTGAQGAVRATPDQPSASPAAEPTRLGAIGSTTRLDLERLVDAALWEEAGPEIADMNFPQDSHADNEQVTAQMEAELGDSAPIYMSYRGPGQV
ncbi:hypothetical protein RSOLAG1IB_11491 [Rhizoctonia solani AG-1 IB]|uniref:Uncharacterized protein n=1 Tax=Thanatephorus cucumeris (strain AG1-IB / isolate 7/3/14) TaxID=1108050 RepID=A0A0B7FA14_THACB|nr:hypothetical protein RSOLAG1IB_11491 [Rhizoctonia solani AG-1 IB]